MISTDHHARFRGPMPVQMEIVVAEALSVEWTGTPCHIRYCWEAPKPIRFTRHSPRNQLVLRGVNPRAYSSAREKSEAVGVRATLTSARTVRALVRDRRGSVLVEFSFIAIPFFMLLFGILETGLVFFGNSMLDKATADAARLVRTGQAQAQNMTAAQFHDYICTQVSPLLTCGANLQVDVEAFTDFGNVNLPDPIDANGNLNPNLNHYVIGGPGDIVLVRTFYTWDIITPLLRPFFSNLSGGQRLMTSAATFRNEPF